MENREEFHNSLILFWQKFFLHCCMKCPQIPREKTSSQKYTVIALCIYLLQINTLGFWLHYLQKVIALIFWLWLPAKSECEIPSDLWWKKNFFFAPLMNNFWCIKSRILSFFFHQKKWGHFAFTFCMYFFHHIQRAITVNFWDEVFSLFHAFGMPSLNNSVCRRILMREMTISNK